MLIRHQDISKEVSEDLDIDIDLVHSVSEFLFGEIKSWVRNPDTLVLYINGLGKFYHRKAKLLTRYDSLCNRELYEHETQEDYDALKKKYEFLLEECDKYSKEKQKYRNYDNKEESDNIT